MSKTIIVFSPHNDDLEIGMGGTALKYIDDGYRIIKLVLSAGQASNPHLRPEVITKRREEEALKVGKEFGIHKTIFFRLNDQKLEEELPKIKDKILEIIKKEKPEKIYLPTASDVHPDHRATFNFGIGLLRKLDLELYSYEVWSVVDEEHPQIYVDITNYLTKKLKMMDMFKTELVSVYLQTIPVLYRAWKYGFKINKKFAERFYKIK
ncbi:PIG-L family deacetylase [Candidatus Woesearchaeota archaeon]|nr:PIG-L family deacetylase [Candidatus Woesearchaeota archaeon]